MYPVILADPPWAYKVWSGDKGMRTAESFYRTLSIQDICSLSVSRLAAKDAALFLWVTAPCLPWGVQVVESWGFRYISAAFVWVKTTKDGRPATGLGHYTRSNAEFCL